jgi:hypothetical protein
MAENNTLFCGGSTRGMFYLSGQFTSVQISSQRVNPPFTGAHDISTDGTDALMIGRVWDHAYVYSGLFTSTVIASTDISSVEANATGISADIGETEINGFSSDTLYTLSGRFTTTIRDSVSTASNWSAFAPSASSWDATNAYFIDQTTEKIYLISGKYTTTLKTSQATGYATNGGITAEKPDTLWCGEVSDTLFKTSGTFTSTIKASLNVAAMDSTIRGIETDDFYGRVTIPTIGDVAFNLPAFVVLGYTGGSASITMPLFTAVGQTGFNADGSLVLPQFNVDALVFNVGSVSITLSMLVQAVQGADQNCDADLTLPIFLHDFAGHEVIDIEVTFPALGGVELGGAFLVGRAYAGTPPKCSVMNTKNFAVSEYKDFAFNSMTRFNGSDIVAGQNGIYELDDTDSDDTDVDNYKIKCHIKTGVVDTYDRVVSRMRDAYLTYRGEDAMELSVLADKSSNRHYTIENNYSNDNLIKIKRIKFERGIKNRHFDFKIANIVGGALEIEKLKIALEPILSKRR